MANVRVELQNGEKIETFREEQIAELLQRLHPEYNARATFCFADGESLSIFGCVSDGFALSRQAAEGAVIFHCPKVLSIADAEKLITRFMRREPEWQAGVSWKEGSRVVEVGIVVLVAAIATLILFLFLKDLRGWLRN